MEKETEFLSYKKVVVFGTVGTGKTTLAKYIESGKFIKDIQHSEKSKKYYGINKINIFLNRCQNIKIFKKIREFKFIKFIFI